MIGFNLKITGIFLGCLLFFWASNGQTLVIPEHYERLKMQKRQKTKEPEKVQLKAPIRYQIHPSNEGCPTAGKAG